MLMIRCKEREMRHHLSQEKQKKRNCSNTQECIEDLLTLKMKNNFEYTLITTEINLTKPGKRIIYTRNN